jgi:hypothetical protein
MWENDKDLPVACQYVTRGVSGGNKNKRTITIYNIE